MNTIAEAGAALAASLYWFKLQFPDGRWTVEEKELDVRPSEGECVDLGASGRWCVSRAQSVHAGPSGKPDREFFVCQPA